jgi:hypothetical protein
MRSRHDWGLRCPGLIRLLLLLHKLPLLHLLQQLLRSFHGGLVRWRLFGLGRTLVRGVIRRSIVGCLGFSSICRLAVTRLHCSRV